ncbi:MAG: hypothetical protein JWO28_975 [Hyphomicrobiales bacterium]|jgi:hypothetical protein|nr:hypothetical protein [Hyphomicrobiales bacterium]
MFNWFKRSARLSAISREASLSKMSELAEIYAHKAVENVAEQVSAKIFGAKKEIILEFVIGFAIGRTMGAMTSHGYRNINELQQILSPYVLKAFRYKFSLTLTSGLPGPLLDAGILLGLARPIHTIKDDALHMAVGLVDPWTMTPDAYMRTYCFTNLRMSDSEVCTVAAAILEMQSMIKTTKH